MGLLIDTSVLVDLERAERQLPDDLDEAAATSVITIAELLHGAARADTMQRRERRSAFTEQVISWLPVIDIDLGVVRRYASLWSATAAAGTPVGAHDLMIAATAQALGWRVWTRNHRDFARIPGIELLETH